MPNPIVERRRFLALPLGAWLASATADADDESSRPEQVEEREWTEVRERAKAAGLGAFRLVRSPRFQAMGNVSEPYLKLVLGDCEDVRADFMAHFAAKKWTPVAPGRRLTVVVLANEIDYGRFLKERVVSLASGGRYDLKSNRLVVFDYRQAEERVAARVGWLNLTTLAHEVTHQLCYNTGVLDREGDCPRSIVEGLATYAEERPPDSRSAIGRPNGNRLDDLANIQRRTPWLPIRSLIATDDALLGKRGGANLLLAYAESWLLVYYLMVQPGLAERFRDYLKTIRPRRDPTRRIADAEQFFGDLGTLDATLKRFSIRLLNSR